jgi:DNA-binding response OmpR family regulator
MAKVLLVDDDTFIRKAFKQLLEGEGHLVKQAKDGIDALEKLVEFSPDIIVVDVMMPRMGGIPFCKKVRETDQLIPIIFFTAVPDDVTAVRAFGCGADDYIDKAKSSAEFISRISAALRRSPYMSMSKQDDDTIFLDGAKIDFSKMTIISETEVQPLTKSEALLLRCLIENRGKVCSVDLLFSALFGDDYSGDENAIRKHISRIRTKLGSAGALIVSERAIGYRLLD